MKQHLVEIKGSTLFDEYLQSMGCPARRWTGSRISICRNATSAPFVGCKANYAFICGPMP